VAALAVAVFHTGQWTHLDLHTGAAGVDLFFVISGFVMWLVTEGRERSPGVFLWRRVRRVAPLYWLMTLLAVLIAAFSVYVRWDVRPELGHILKSLAFIPHFNPAGLPFPALAQGWTLTYEALFYALFTLALLLPRERQFLALALVLAGFFIVGYGNPPFYVLIGNSLLAEFVLGMGLARAWLARGLPGARWGLAWMILGVIALFASFPIGGDDPGNWRAIVWGLPATAIVGGALSIERAGRWPKLPWLERLGDASYALYLSHRLAITGACLALAALPLIVILPAAVLAAVAAGLALHWLVERPLLKALKV
jgi:exopolysaccharide production protein ExoZ